jgi:hypothetical protein
MKHVFALLCCVAAACGPKPAPVTPVQTAQTSVPAETTSTPATSTPTTTQPTPAATQVAGNPAAHCLFVEPEHRVVRCYWKREDCEQQIEFNKGVVAGNQTCEATAEAHCFDENGKNQLCYPSAADCDGMVAKMKKRNRPVSQCASKRGP